ncbi:MAG: sulfatase [Armatimonadota bacterium]|jgi:arylsulfatase A-like enzyme
MNIILAIIDTLRYDHIGANGNDWVKTPHMDRFTAESWAFDFSFAASYPTIPHRTDVITGRYGAPFHAWKPLDVDKPTIPRALAEHGYCTQLIHDTPHLVNGGHRFDYPFHAWTFVRGAEVDRPWIDDSSEWLGNWFRDPLFDDYDDDLWPGGTNFWTYGRANRGRERDEDWNCAKLFVTGCEFLRDNASRENFFLWLDCFDPHEPWDAPPEFVKLYDDDADYDGRIDPRTFAGAVRNDPDLSEERRRRLQIYYAAKVSWVDRWFGELLDTLESTGLADSTAVILTADHGTNCGERGRFGKGFPVREQEGRTPFVVRVPDGGSGRSDAIVAPQDVFATVMGIAGLETPESIESHNVLRIAQEGSGGPRGVALAGRGVAQGARNRPRGDILYTVFDSEWYLEHGVKPEDSRLTRYGSLEDVAEDNPGVVQELRAAGIEEMARRGTSPRLIEWLRSGGEGELDVEWLYSDAHPAPSGWQSYFQNLYNNP